MSTHSFFKMTSCATAAGVRVNFVQFINFPTDDTCSSFRQCTTYCLFLCNTVGGQKKQSIECSNYTRGSNTLLNVIKHNLCNHSSSAPTQSSLLWSTCSQIVYTSIVLLVIHKSSFIPAEEQHLSSAIIALKRIFQVSSGINRDHLSGSIQSHNNYIKLITSSWTQPLNKMNCSKLVDFKPVSEGKQEQQKMTPCDERGSGRVQSRQCYCISEVRTAWNQCSMRAKFCLLHSYT